MIDTTQKSQTSNPTDWSKVEYFISEKGRVVYDPKIGEWRGYVNLRGFKDQVVKEFRILGDGNTYASAEAAKSAVERTWAKHNGVYGDGGRV